MEVETRAAAVGSAALNVFARPKRSAAATSARPIAVFARFRLGQLDRMLFSLGKNAMDKDEVDLNDPLHWFIADSVDDFDRGCGADDRPRLVSREALTEMGQILGDAISFLENEGHREKAAALRDRIRKLTERA